MTNADRRTYNAALHEFINDYAKLKRVHILDVIDAAGDLIDEHYFNEPKPDRAEMLQLLTEYAADNGEPITNILDVLMGVLEQEIDAYIDSGKEDDD